jgi:hypothetical protein
MLTYVWGPAKWHYLHTMSFNYPVKPTAEQKKHYKEYIFSLTHTLPCGACRRNLVENLKAVPLNSKALKNRENFSKWMFDLHEQVNKMLGKKSGLTFERVRERYENFRARCSLTETISQAKQKKKESGCTEPLVGTKSKCVINIVPKETKVKTLNIDKNCVTKKVKQSKKQSKNNKQNNTSKNSKPKKKPINKKKSKGNK